MLGLWLAIAAALFTIAVVYFSLFKILKFLYQRYFAWFVAFIILLSPFVFVLLQVRNLLELLWIILLTPFYSVIVLSAVSTIWIARFYCVSFSILIIAQLLLQRRVNKDKHINELNRSRDKFEFFLARHLKRHVRFVEEGKKGFNRLVRRGNIFFYSLWKYRSFVLVFVLLSTLTTTFASSSRLRDPTYSEARQFVHADDTDRNPYVIGSYTCANFAADFRSNALRSGYECGIVFLYFPDNTRHAINGFNTTDKGLVFVEPQSDIFVNVTVGKRYQIERITSSFKNDTVIGYYVDW